MPLLQTLDLRKDFGGLAAVDGVDFGLEAGALHALVGPNGCGKSTLFNLISGALAPSGGQVFFDGAEITGLAPHDIARRGVGRKFQVPAVFDALSVAQNLAVPAWARDGLSYWRAADTDAPLAALAQVGLAGKRDLSAGELSHGERQWLEIAMLLASRARLLLLDEPTAGMTMTETAATAELIGRLAAGGDVTVLVIEHDMAFLQDLGCPVTVMAKGRILRSGDYASIRADAEVRELYFGRGR